MSDISSDTDFPFGGLEASNGSRIALKEASVSGVIEGLLFSFTLHQEYKNETSDPIEVIYTFPLGWDTALLGLKANIGGKRLEGQVVQKAQAEEQYEKAVTQGDSAILVEKSIQGLYTPNLVNIKPD